MNPVGLDLETWLSERARLAPPIVCGSFGFTDRAEVHKADMPRFWMLIRQLLTREDLCVVGANIAYDTACICAADSTFIPLVFAAYKAGRIHDVCLRDKMHDIALGQEIPEKDLGLEEVATRHGFVVSKDTTWRLEYATLANVPIEDWPAEAVEYCRQDAEIPRQIFLKQEEVNNVWRSRTGHDLFGLSSEEALSAFSLQLMSAHGIRTDRERVCALIKDTRAHLCRLRERLVAEGLVRGDTKRNHKGDLVSNPQAGSRNVKAARDRMARVCSGSGIEPKRTEKGEICLDEDACLLSGDELLISYAESASAARTETLLDDLQAGVDLPLQARFVSMVDTYRTSSRKPKPPIRGMQMQNFSQKGGIRECLTPRPGNVFIVADVTAMEAHFFAQFCRDMGFGTTLLDTLNSGVDIHRRLAAATYGIPEEQVTKEQRDMAKPGNYGFMGGMAEDTFCLTQRKNTGRPYPRELAVKLRAAWKKLYPETGPFFAYIERLCKEGKGKGTLRHPSTGAWRTAPYCSLANFTFQHPSAIGVKRALNRIQELSYSDTSSSLFGCRAWNMIHDEICAEAPVDRAHEAAVLLGEMLTWGVNTLLPNCPTKAPPVVCRMWSKGAKATYHNGRLIPT